MAGREATFKVASVFPEIMLATNVYVDGFNLYYGALKGTPYRWLDILRLCKLLLPNETITSIKYFTAKVKAKESNPSQAQRQQFYLRALETIPNLSIHYGHFLSNTVKRPLADGSGMVDVIKKALT